MRVVSGAQRERAARGTTAGTTAETTAEIGATVAVVLGHWSEPFEVLLTRIVDILATGRRALVVGDVRVPAAATLALQLLLDSGVCPDRLAMLHGMDDALLVELLGEEAVRAVVGCADSRRVARVRASLEERPLCEQRLQVPRSISVRLDASDGDALEERARFLAEAAFSRAGALSGQAAGRLGRVHVPERLFSRFQAALLDVLETHPDLRAPLDFLDAEVARAAVRTRALGLDQGATLIFEGGETVGRAGTPAWGSVFTNVEPSSGFAREQRPAPVLGLLRMP